MDTQRVAVMGALLLAACGDARRPGPEEPAPQLAGGETSEFSGGNVPFGACPTVLSRTALDFEREDVAPWLALAVGHHDLGLRWRRELPTDTISGFDESTRLLLDVTPVAVEEVVCGGYGGGYETEGLEGQRLRRFELRVELSTADGAIRAAFQSLFLQVPSAERRLLDGGMTLPFEDVSGTLELGVDPELADAVKTLAVQLTFHEQSVKGTLTPWVSLPGPVLGDDTPRWAPVTGTFPAPDDGCDVGSLVSLDEHLGILGGTPRDSYEAARSTFPTEPLTAAWEDPVRSPGSLTWTDVTLRPGRPTHACTHAGVVDVYTSLRVETGDGRLVAEPPLIANVSWRPNATNTVSIPGLWMQTRPGWAPRTDFEATASIRDLDLGLAEYVAFNLWQSFNVDREKLEGELYVVKWESYLARGVDVPPLRWCVGEGCELDWCLRTRGEASCL